MLKPSSTSQAPRISPAMADAGVSFTQNFFRNSENSSKLLAIDGNNVTYNNLIRSLLKVERIELGHVTCLLSIKPPILNYYGSLHGGVGTGIAKLVCTACARTVAAEDKKLFLGELAVTYLSAAIPNVNLMWWWKLMDP
ncbi:hypothetical protein NE237_023247 [Protea cynaroides]|uniref:Thioesterase domain-containing protein n=1 Tax=Protea cynaroides TaxID=273540 RepID=A0A9Q0HEK3_9MAGN|nr:hypothetical protein NE237_023247 [Protea cynaroides]